MNRKLILLASACLLSSIASAEQIRVDIDPAKTHITWELGGTLHAVHGTFQVKRGQVVVDTSSGSASGTVVIDTTSGESGNESRDKRMHREVLESDRFPEATFMPKKVDGPVQPTGASNVRITARILLHGAGHEITMPMQLRIAGNEVTGQGKLVIPYVEWGMKDPSNFLLKVGKTVVVEINAFGLAASGAKP